MLKTKVEVVGPIGFEPTPTQPFQTLAGLGWQPKYRNGSQRNNYWTRIGHCSLLVAFLFLSACALGQGTAISGVTAVIGSGNLLGWGPNDVYLRLSHLVPATQASPARFVVEVRAAVNMAWAQAKFLRDMLTDAIERYEIANGELKWPELATQNAQEARASNC